jgi:flagellar hook-length control protein FliK
MHHSLTTVFTSLTAQPPSDRPAVRAAARDRAALGSPVGDQGRPEEFRLPAQPRERTRAPERSRDRSDEPRGSETRASQNARETPPRREDPPRRSDPPRGHDRPRDGEPPHRQDAPGARVRGAEDPPRRADLPGATKGAEVRSRNDETVREATAPEVETETVEEAAEGETVIVETRFDLNPLASPAACSTAAPPLNPAMGETGGDLSAGEIDGTLCNVGEGEETEVLSASDAALAGQAQSNPAQQASAAAAVAASTAIPAASAAVQQDAGMALGPSTSTEAIEGTGAKPTSPQDKHLALQGAEQRDQNARTEAGQSAHEAASVLDGGTAAKPPVKADHPLTAALDPTSAGPPASPTSSPIPPAAQVPAVPNAPVRVVAEVPLGAVPVEIGLKSLAGVNHFEIRLDPAELGRIEVRLQIDEEGGIKAHLTVDKVETLALLQRDSRSLERAFEQAGLKSTDGSVDLSLRDGQSQGQGRQEQGGEQRRDATRGPDRSRDDADAALKEAPPRRLWRGAAGVDVHV